MSETRICANCGAEYPIEDMYQAEGDWLCEDCADRLTVICDHCAERVYEEKRRRGRYPHTLRPLL